MFSLHQFISTGETFFSSAPNVLGTQTVYTGCEGDMPLLCTHPSHKSSRLTDLSHLWSTPTIPPPHSLFSEADAIPYSTCDKTAAVICLTAPCTICSSPSGRWPVSLHTTSTHPEKGESVGEGPGRILIRLHPLIRGTAPGAASRSLVCHDRKRRCCAGEGEEPEWRHS